MKKRKKAVLLFASALCICLSGCSLTEQQPVETEASAVVRTETVEKAESSLEDYHLRENKTIYEQDDETSVVTMYLTVREGNEAEHTNHTWTEINSYSKYWYEDNNIEQYAVEGILQVGDENGPLEGEAGYGENAPNAIIKIRGQSSSKGAQKNYKIELKDGKDTWRGQRTINLNKHMFEGLRFRNKLAYDLMKDIPQMISARTQFVHLYVKDETEGGSGVFEDYGLFTQVEQMNKTFLKSHGLDKNGHMYKVNFFEFMRYEDAIRLATDPAYDQTAFEEHLEIKGDNDHTKLIAMLNDVNDYSIPIEETVEKWFDTENLFYWMGFQILLGNIDTSSRNYYLYSPLNVNKFYIISWDNDGSLEYLEEQLKGKDLRDTWEYGLSNYWGNVLYQRMFKNEEYRRELTDVINTLRSDYLTPERVSEKVNSYKSVTKPYLYSMPDVLYAPLTEAEFEQVADNIPKEIEENYQRYLESLERPMPFYIGVPEPQEGKLTVNWDAAYDFDSENITYTFELARDCLFKDILFSDSAIRIPQAELDMPGSGQYFIRVTAKNESGKTQTAFDYYYTDDGKVYGTKCFYVLEDGSIEEDTENEDS